MTRILLYTPEPVSALGLFSLLASRIDLVLVCTCPTAGELLDAMKGMEPDVLLLDLTSDVTFKLLRELRQKFSRSRVLLWVNEISMELAFQVMGLGARGIARKTLSADALIDCLQRVGQGELWFDKALTDNMLSSRKVSLTRREGQLVTLLSQGLKNKQIAAILCVSENTIKVYLSRLFQKVGVKDRFELALYGLRNVAAGQGRLDQPAQKPWDLQEVVGLRSIVLDGLQTRA